MTKIKYYTIAILLLFVCSSVDAQTKKTTTRRPRAKTTKVETPKVEEEENKDTVVAVPEPEPEKPKYKCLSDPQVVRYLRGGFAKDGKLHLVTNADYDSLKVIDKQTILTKVAQEFADHDINIYSGGQQRELWVNTSNGIKMIERWNNDSLQIERYLPLELKRQGFTKVFYYVGGMVSGNGDYTNLALNLRFGSYLYKNLVDASVTMNMGGNITDEESNFVGDLGIDSRVYLPFRIKKVNIAPYAGAGISWSFAPSSFFEAKFLAGGCWFVGPGSFDIGLQYGIESGFGATLGYTFRIPAKKKKK